jgi:hypothetical protein
MIMSAAPGSSLPTLTFFPVDSSFSDCSSCCSVVSICCCVTEDHCRVLTRADASGRYVEQRLHHVVYDRDQLRRARIGGLLLQQVDGFFIEAHTAFRLLLRLERVLHTLRRLLVGVGRGGGDADAVDHVLIRGVKTLALE